jgi:hypothetical protein
MASFHFIESVLESASLIVLGLIDNIPNDAFLVFPWSLSRLDLLVGTNETSLPRNIRVVGALPVAGGASWASSKSSLDALGDSDAGRLELMLMESFCSMGRSGISLGSELDFCDARLGDSPPGWESISL